MKDLTDLALDAATAAGASYADVRVERLARQIVAVKDGHPNGLVEDESQGFGVRVVAGGAWGFASSARLDVREIERVARLAVEIAHASALTSREPVDLGEPIRSVGSYATPVQIDPFTVSVDVPGGSFAFSGLAPGASQTRTWSGCVEGQLTAVADSGGQVAESNEGNNSRSTPGALC